jgi:hypothetical protein
MQQSLADGRGFTKLQNKLCGPAVGKSPDDIP